MSTDNDRPQAAKIKRKNVNGRWMRAHTRCSVNTMIDDTRWIKNSKGQWQKKDDSIDELSYCMRRRERPGFRKGARITRLIHSTLDIQHKAN